MVDANQSFSYHSVMKISRELAAFDLTFIEEPLPINDLDSMAALTTSLEVPVAAGENYYTRYEFREVMLKHAVNIIQPDVIHAGGLTETARVVAMAESMNIPLAPHIHATVGVSAAIHLLTAATNTLAAEYITTGGSYKLRKEMCGDTFLAEDGWIRANDEPGLGIHINEEVFEKYYPRNM
jgi:L-alanine-DL-glutamate epimerase-like enolase superfamily enzyme